VRALRPALVLLLIGLAALPSAQAALNGARDYEASYGYLPGLGGATFTMVSGETDTVIPNGEGTWGFFATAGAEVNGLTRACWTAILRTCADSPSGGLSIRVLPGGSFGMRFPTGADAGLEADHAIAMFVDLSESGNNLNSLRLGRSLVSPVVGGVVSFTTLPEIPASTIIDPTSDQGGAIAATEAATTIEVYDGPVQRASLSGKVDPVTFAGRPTIPPFTTELAIMPFEGSGAVARFVGAGPDAAGIGLDIGRINRLMTRLYAANQGNPTPAQELDEAAFGPYRDAAAALFGGAVLSLPTDGNAERAGQELAFARTPRLEVRGVPGGSGLAWSGQATFDVHDGKVEGAQPLYGFGFIALPWWGWLLWAAAIAVWIVRLVRKPDKKHPTWDRFKWVGWVASPLVFLLVFVLWDFEFRAVLGLSLFSGDASGQLLVFVALLQVATFGILSFAAIAPLRMLLRNGSLLLHQGTFMGLAGAAASILGLLIGFGVLRSGLALVVEQVLAGLS
jgi:hypothetical protein